MFYCWCFFLLFSSPNLGVPLANCHQIFPHVRQWEFEMYWIKNFGPSHKFGAPKTWIFCTKFWSTSDLMTDNFGLEQIIITWKNALKTTDTPLGGSVILCILIANKKLLTYFWPTVYKYFKLPYLGLQRVLPQQKFVKSLSLLEGNEWQYLTNPSRVGDTLVSKTFLGQKSKFCQKSVQIHMYLRDLWKIYLKILHIQVLTVLQNQFKSF